MKYDEKISQYYDLIFSGKKYREEVDFIKSLCYSKDRNYVLDVGCGTGNHSLILAEDNRTVKILGIDESKSMIDVAQKKVLNEKIKFQCSSLADIEETNFDTIISMFNVINHIHDIPTLYSFFSEVRLRLTSTGSFLFDCWNGAATFGDPPKCETRHRLSEKDISIQTTCNPVSDLMNSQIMMNNTVSIYNNDTLVEKFDYSLKHAIWTPGFIKSVLKDCGFKTIKIFKHFEKKYATIDDYKIVFVCTPQ